MHPARRRLIATFGLLALLGFAAARQLHAGPPLVVDDPETLDRGHFELFTSFLYAKEGSLRSYDAPSQLTIGLAKGWECSINAAYQYHAEVGGTPDTVNGVLSLEVGTKFRLLNQAPDMPVSLALSGRLRFPISSNAKYADQGKPSGGAILVLARKLGEFSVNANVGYGVGGAQNRDLVSDAWFFGLAAQRIFAKKYTLFTEVYAMPQVGRFRDAVINADGGLLWDLSDRYRITVLLGRGFRPGGAEFIGNLGFLLSLGPAAPAAKPSK